MFSINPFSLSLSLLLLLLLILWKKREKKRREPTLFLSSVQSLCSFQGKGRTPFLPRYLYWITFFLFLLASIDIHWKEGKNREKEKLEKQEEKESPLSSQKDLYADRTEEKKEKIHVPTEGIAIYFLLDQSPSMEEEMNYGRRGKNASRMHVLKELTIQFIQGNKNFALQGRMSDMIGIISFARIPKVLSPLTLHHSDLIRKLIQLETVTHEEEAGTAIGYALLKATKLIEATRLFAHTLEHEGLPPYEIKNQIIILVTDGFQTLHPADSGYEYRHISLIEAAREAKNHSIRLYIINIEPAINHPNWHAQRKELEEAAQLTEGGFYIAQDGNHLGEIYQEIDQLEKSRLPFEQEYLIDPQKEGTEKKEEAQRLFSLYPLFIFLGITTLSLAVILETTKWRTFP